MSQSEIRVVVGPANYFSHTGSLSRLHDFFTDDILSRAVWVYGERAIAAARPICLTHLIMTGQSTCYLPVIAAKQTFSNWQKMPVITAAW